MKINIKEGIRILLLLNRSSNKAQKSAHKKISSCEESFDKCLKELQDLRQTLNDDDWRIYSTLNERDSKKAILEFKRNQILADYNDDTSFYFRAHDKIVSAFMKSNKTNYFLFDADSDHEIDVCNHEIPLECYINDYETPSGGRHFITLPFNYTNTKLANVALLKKDALIMPELFLKETEK